VARSNGSRAATRQLAAPQITELPLRRGVVSHVGRLVEVPFDLLETEHWRTYAAARQITRPISDAMFQIGLAKRDAAGNLRPSRAAVLLFAEHPAGQLDSKCSIRLFQYKGDQIEHGPSTNLARPPITVDGPLILQIQRATASLVSALATGVRVGPLGFEIAQAYPVRVLTEAITNAVLHRDYRAPGDIHIRVFDNRVEVESPGVFPGPVTAGNIATGGSHPRNRGLIDHLREFPSPPNLDAGEGVRMMVQTMARADLYPPVYLSQPDLQREAVVVTMWNLARPTVWDQVAAHLKRHRTIGNAEVRVLLRTEDALRASKQIKAWVDAGLLVVDNPHAGKRSRRYRGPSSTTASPLLFLLPRKTI